MECSRKNVIYHKQTIVDEDGVVQTLQDLTGAVFKTIEVSTKRKIDQQGQTHVYTVRVIKKYGVQLNLF